MGSPGEGERHAHEVELEIVRTILARALPVLMLLSAVSLAIALAALRENPLRLASTSLAPLMCCVAWVLVRRGRPYAAVWALVATLAVISAFAMVFNGGLRAPAAALPLALVSMVGWAFGRTAATRIALCVAGGYVAVAGLSAVDALRVPAPAPPLIHAAFLSVYVWLVWLTTAFPQQQLRTALSRAVDRERALELAQSQRAEADLAFRAVFEHTPHVLVLVTPDGRIQAANRSAQALLGAAATDLQNRPLLDALPWPDRDALAQALVRAAASRQTLRVELPTSRGPARFELTLAPFLDAAGALRYVIVEAQDLTAVVEEEERKAHARRLEAVGRLASGVAHDFNNVLAVVVSSAEVVRDELSAKTEVSADVTEALDAIRDVSMRASDLSRRLLNLARKTPSQRRVVSMHTLLENTTKLLTRTLPANITITRDARAEDDTVLADDSSLESALLNLAVNAKDAMPRGGTLTFATRNVDLDEGACRRSGVELTPGRYLRIDVKDTGAGIEPELRERIFEPFFTTKGDGRGTGIGLASVFGALRSHGGVVQVQSEVGRGTTFMLDLPVAPKDSAAAASVKPRSGFAGVRALVVDDEPALLRTLAHQLEGLGMPCVRASNAEDAWAEFSKAPSSFQVAVLDHLLPGELGAALAARLLSLAPQLKVVLVTGSARDEVPVNGLPADRIAVLGKPFTADALRATLDGLLGSRASA